jgi:hypothetical protein
VTVLVRLSDGTFFAGILSDALSKVPGVISQSTISGSPLANDGMADPKGVAFNFIVFAPPEHASTILHRSGNIATQQVIVAASSRRLLAKRNGPRTSAKTPRLSGFGSLQREHFPSRNSLSVPFWTIRKIPDP